jgi:AcrR family transcriptional regulator
MGVKERHERERLAVRHSILAAARELFVSQGYRNVSMRKIAERIEYSAAAIYSYFPSKDDIFFALAEEGFRVLADYCVSAADHVADPVERLRLSLRAFYQFSKDYPEHFELMFIDRSVPSLTQDWHRFEFFNQLTHRAEADIRTAIERGRFAPHLDAAAVLHVLWVAVLGAAAINLARRLAPAEDPDALAHDVIENLLAGLAAPGATTTFVACDCPFSAASEGASTIAADSDSLSHDA